MTPIEESIEADRKLLEQEPEAEGLDKIIDEATKPEPEPEPADEPEDEDDEPLDKAAAHEKHAKSRITAREEREARIAAEIQAAELRGRMAAQEEYRNQQQAQTQAQPQARIPDPDLEPEEYIRHQQMQHAKDLDMVARYAKESRDQLMAQQLNILTDLAETKASTADPDYMPAKSFLIEKQHALLKHQHADALRIQHNATPEQVDNYLRQYATKQVEEHVIMSVQRKQDVAKSVKEMAALYGYTPAGSEKKTEQGYKPNLSNIKKNMGKASNLMGGSARGKSGSPSAEQLAEATLADLLGVPSNEFDTALQNFH